MLAFLSLVALAPHVAQPPIALPPDRRPEVLVTLESTAGSATFASQHADTRLQNVAEVVRQLGARVVQADTMSFGVTRRPDVNDGYPPPPFVARYVLRLRLASRDDVRDVTTALSAAGATRVRVTYATVAGR